jgi:hypothetical protein
MSDPSEIEALIGELLSRIDQTAKFSSEADYENLGAWIVRNAKSIRRLIAALQEAQDTVAGLNLTAHPFEDDVLHWRIWAASASRRREEAESELARLREALENIASNPNLRTGSMVLLARAALTDSKGK